MDGDDDGVDEDESVITRHLLHGDKNDADDDKSAYETDNRNHNDRHPLTLLKTTVFLSTISQAGWNRFSAVYMLSHGFTPSQIGKINSLSNIAKAIAQPFWGVLSDATGPLSAMIASTILGTATLVAVRASIDAGSASSLAVWRMIRSAVTATSPALDALMLQLVEGSGEGYGRQRLWGSIAWGLSSLLAGTILDEFEDGWLFAYTYFASGVLLFFFVMLRRVLPDRNEEVGLKKKPQANRINLGGAVWSTWHDLVSGGQHSLAIWAILFHSFGYGTLMVLFDNILMLQLERDFEMSRRIQGVFTLVSVLSTLPVYHYSQKIREIMGHFGMIQSSLLIAALRLCLTKFACSGAVSDGGRTAWLLVLQLLHGYHFAANWVASVEFLDTMASRRNRSLMQFLLNMSYFTAGAGAGNLWWSVVYENQGGQEAYSRGLWLCMLDYVFVRLFSSYKKHHIPTPDRRESSEIESG